jgi:hypothetical protein
VTPIKIHDTIITHTHCHTPHTHVPSSLKCSCHAHTHSHSHTHTHTHSQNTHTHTQSRTLFLHLLMSPASLCLLFVSFYLPLRGEVGEEGAVVERIPVCLRVCVCACEHTHIYMHIHAHTHTHSHIHTHTHICTSTYIHTLTTQPHIPEIPPARSAVDAVGVSASLILTATLIFVEPVALRCAFVDVRVYVCMCG